MNFTQNQPTAEMSKGLRLLHVTLLALIIVGIGLLATQRMWVPGLVTYLLEQEGNEMVVPSEVVVATSTPTVRDIDVTFAIDGKEVTLVGGVSNVAVVPGSATSVVTQYFGNEVTLDLDQDGQYDRVFLVTSDGGGSGVFFYVVGALATPYGYTGMEAVFLGDRIAPQVTELGKNNTVVVNYADRSPGESFAVSPSVGKSLVLKFDPESKQFGEVVQDFEGEASAEVMTLTMKEWEWTSAEYADGSIVTPKTPGVFGVTFSKDGTFSVATDCNRAGGSYTSTGDALTFGNMFSTKMYCEGAQEEVFTALLSDVTEYHFTGKGELILGLKSDGGTVTLR